MSGGSWDYLYLKIGEAAARLEESNTMSRCALGVHLGKVAAAMHAIEWNDSGDGADNELDLIAEVLTGTNPFDVVQMALAKHKAELEQFEAWFQRKKATR